MSLEFRPLYSIRLELKPKLFVKGLSKVKVTVRQPWLVYYGLVAQPWMLDPPLAPRHHAASEAAAYHCSKVTQPVNSVNTVYLLSRTLASCLFARLCSFFSPLAMHPLIAGLTLSLEE